MRSWTAARGIFPKAYLGLEELSIIFPQHRVLPLIEREREAASRELGELGDKCALAVADGQPALDPGAMVMSELLPRMS